MAYDIQDDPEMARALINGDMPLFRVVLTRVRPGLDEKVKDNYSAQVTSGTPKSGTVETMKHEGLRGIEREIAEGRDPISATVDHDSSGDITIEYRYRQD
jgi:hypothetical protein